MGGFAGARILAFAAVAAVSLLLAPAPPCLAGACPVDLFREYDPTNPPGILTDPRAAQIYDSPWVDPDPSAARLVFYRVNVRTSAPDPDYPLIFVRRSGDAAVLDWGGSRDPAACCFGYTCSMLCERECADAGGTYMGDGTSCSDVPPPCGVPPAACCNGDVCSMAVEAGCTAGGGTYKGDGTSCTDLPPPCELPAACCNGNTCSMQLEADCAAASGTYMGAGTSCADVPPPCGSPAACCNGTVCSSQFEDDCVAGGGVYMGDGTGCADVPPPCEGPLPAACCDGSVCTMELQADCAAAGGTYTGDGTSCADLPPPCGIPAACCAGVLCSMLLASECAAGGGTYMGDGTSCSDVPPPCGVASACCVGGVCSMRLETECAAVGGIYKGDGTKCSDVPPPCGGPSSCVPSSPYFGLAKPSGGGAPFGALGFPTTMPVDLYSIATSTGLASPEGLHLDPETQRPWNFTGAQDPAGHLYYFIGGRAGDAAAPPSIVTIDTATSTLVRDVPLDPAADIMRLDFDHGTKRLYVLALNAAQLVMSGGHVYFPGSLALGEVFPVTGQVPGINVNLPGGLDHLAATLDSANHRYLYSTYVSDPPPGLAQLHKVNLTTGAVTSVDLGLDLANYHRIVGLEWDDATGTLYGLESWGSTTFSSSGTDGYRTFGEIALVRIDETTGALTQIGAGPLPTGTTNWIDAFDCSIGYYLYLSDTGEAQILDVSTGDLVSTSPPPPDSRFHSLD